MPKINTTAQTIAAFWRNVRPTRLREMIPWAESELRLPSGPMEGRRYKVNRLPYARLLLPELGKWRRHVITGPTQSGKSWHAFAMVIAYYLFEMKEHVIVGLPDLNMAGSKWEKDIKPIIEQSRYREFMPIRGAGSQGGKANLITFRNGKTLQFMAGGGNDKQRAAATARVMIITETDGLDEVSQTSKEGQSKVDQLEGRVRSYGLEAKIFMECTVTNSKAKTWREYKAGTESRIACQCPACEAWVTPEREHFVGWDQAETKLEAGEKAAFSCPECGKLYSEDERRVMNEGAVLVHRGQEVTPDGKVVGDPPRTDTLGFRWSAFNNLLTPMSLIGMEEWQAERSEDPIVADITIRQQVWCMPADVEEVEKVPLSIGIVRGSASGYFGRCNGREMWSVPDWTEYITAHIDVGLRVLNWSVNAHGPRGVRDIIAYGATATEQPDVIGPEEAILAGLHQVRELIEQRTDPHCVLVDCGHQFNDKAKNPRRIIYEFVLSCGGVWSAAMGLASWSAKPLSDDIEPSLTGAPWYYSKQQYLGQELWVVDFDPNHFKHLSHGSFLIAPSSRDLIRANGSVTLFGNDPKAHNEFASQMNNERFEVDHKTGKSAWKRHSHNHYFDTDVGNIVARSVLESISIAKRRNSESKVESPAPPVQSPDGRAFYVGNRHG